VKVTKGKHQVKVRYLGSPVVAPAGSAAVTIRGR
jgi:hypothetical protein